MSRAYDITLNELNERGIRIHRGDTDQVFKLLKLEADEIESNGFRRKLSPFPHRNRFSWTDHDVFTEYRSSGCHSFKPGGLPMTEAPSVSEDQLEELQLRIRASAARMSHEFYPSQGRLDQGVRRASGFLISAYRIQKALDRNRFMRRIGISHTVHGFEIQKFSGKYRMSGKWLLLPLFQLRFRNDKQSNQTSTFTG